MSDNYLISDSKNIPVENLLGKSFSDELQGPSQKPNRIVSARGTEEGLILRIDGRAHWAEILTEVESFLGDRRRFLEGGEIGVEWLERLPTAEQNKELQQVLREKYGIEILHRRRHFGERISPPQPDFGKDRQKEELVSLRDLLECNPVRSKSLSSDLKEPQETLSRHLEHAFHSGLPNVEAESLQEGPEQRGPLEGSALAQHAEFPADMAGSIEGKSFSESGKKKANPRLPALLDEHLLYDDDANAKVIFGTLRSGQRVETPFSLVVVGDVNPGADLIAGGDIFVFGSLKGTAHASAYDEDQTHRVIVALHMQPMQLRIGSVVSRGCEESVQSAEIARIEERRIIVEAYNPRVLQNHRRGR